MPVAVAFVRVRTGATFRIKGVDPERATKLLGIEPTSSIREGDPHPANGRPQPVSSWHLTVEPASDVELETPLMSLLDRLEQARLHLRTLLDDGASFDFFCYLGSSAAEHCAILRPELLRRIGDIPAELWLDVYGT